jgi:mono/diheme cytochrome c family protein
MKPSATVLGCRVIAVLATLIVAAACSAAGGDGPTAAPPSGEAGPETMAVVTATGESIASALPTLPAGATADLSGEMYAVLEAHQCLGCHTIGERGNGVVGPSLDGLAARIDTYGLAQSAEAYLYEALVNPAAYLPASCPTGQCANVMPSYADRLSDDELSALVAFLLNLPSETP